MSSDTLLKELLRYVLPAESVNYFEITDIQETAGTLHFYLDESSVIPDEHRTGSLSAKGFYDESTIRDFPLHDRKAVLHVRRRRRVDADGKSYSRHWDLVAQGTRYSKEFAFF